MRSMKRPQAGCSVFIVHARNAWLQGLSPKKTSPTDPVFFDETKTIIEWPERSAYVIEELR